MNFSFNVGKGFREQMWDPFAVLGCDELPRRRRGDVHGPVPYFGGNHGGVDPALGAAHPGLRGRREAEAHPLDRPGEGDLPRGDRPSLAANEEAAGTLNATLTSVAVVDAAVAPAEKALDELHVLPTPGGRLVEFYALSDQLIVVLHHIRGAYPLRATPHELRS